MVWGVFLSTFLRVCMCVCEREHEKSRERSKALTSYSLSCLPGCKLYLALYCRISGGIGSHGKKFVLLDPLISPLEACWWCLPRKLGAGKRNKKRETIKNGKNRRENIAGLILWGCCSQPNKHSRISPASQRDVTITPEHLDLLCVFLPVPERKPTWSSHSAVFLSPNAAN